MPDVEKEILSKSFIIWAFVNVKVTLEEMNLSHVNCILQAGNMCHSI